MKTGRVIINNLNIYYYYENPKADKVVVFLHGWGLSARSWTPVMDGLVSGEFAQSQDCECSGSKSGDKLGILALDFAGFGDSGQLARAFSLDDYVALTLEFLRKKAAGKELILVGHSFGGRVIVKMLSGEQDLQIAQIIFVGVPFFREMSVKIKALSSVAGILGKFLIVPPLSWIANPIRRIGYKVFGVDDYASLRSITMRDTFRNVVGEEIGVYLPQFAQNNSDVKIDMIWGARDIVVPPRIMRRAIDTLSPLITTPPQTHIISKAGHIPWNDNLRKFNEVFGRIICTRSYAKNYKK